MRLLNTTSLKFKEFFEDQIPPYAILSHTWGSSDEEVSFHDMAHLSPRILEKDRRDGYSKIVNTCRLALEDGLEYAWVDTCCIDKSSSAELTEAINSMFRWYERASMCYVYLADVTPQTSLEEGLKSCRWITRGWTLQELIAPRECHLLDGTWTCRGTKTKLKELLADLTGVPGPVLANEKLPRDYSVAQRMSWAAKRTTTRREDMAYCLLGLFGIHMPMIYGEGEMAFHRLQEEIIRRMDDPTIFTWEPADAAPDIIGILAASPAPFQDLREPMGLGGFQPMEFTLTNKGVKVVNAHINVTIMDKNKQPRGYILVLKRGATSENETTGIHLRKIDGTLFCRVNRPMRVSSRLLPSRMHMGSGTEIYVADFCTSLITPSMILDSRRCALQILLPGGFEIIWTTPQRLWDWEDSCFLGSDWGASLVQWCTVDGLLGGVTVRLVILCDRRPDNGRGKPVLSVFERYQYMKDYDYLDKNRYGHTGDDLAWWKIDSSSVILRDHGSSIIISLPTAVYKLSILVAKKTVSIREGDVELYQARLEVARVK